MSKYLSKKAVLEFIKARKAKFAGSYKDVEYGAYLELETFEAHLGEFDADVQMSQTDVYRAADEILTLRNEIQRLRAAAIKLHETLNTYWQGDCEKADVVAAQSNLCDILTTTTKGDGNDA